MQINLQTWPSHRAILPSYKHCIFTTFSGSTRLLNPSKNDGRAQDKHDKLALLVAGQGNLPKTMFSNAKHYFQPVRFFRNVFS